MTTVELFATPAQMEIVNCMARFIGFFAGRRWGKTDTWFNRCARRCLERPIEYLYVAPSYALAKEQFERMAQALREFIRKTIMQPKPMLIFYNGSRCQFRSWDKPKFIRGFKAHEVWVDEIQDIDESRFWPILRPLISDTRGTLIVSGQFRGHNWYYKQFYEKGQQPGQTLYKSFVMPSSTGLMFQDPLGREELRIAKEQLPRVEFEQEYECVALANVNAVFLADDLKAVARGELSPPRAGHRYVAAYDLGEMHDPSFLTIMDAQTMAVVFTRQVPLRTKHETQSKNLAADARRYNNAQVVIDASGGAAGGQKTTDENIRHYRREIPSVRALVWNPNFKRELVRNALLAVEGHHISIPAECGELHRQLAAFEFERKGEDWIYRAPKGDHDDAVASLMMAVHAIKAGWAGSNDTSGLKRIFG